MQARRTWHRADAAAAATAHGTFVPPTLIEIRRVAELEREVFGPVLHVLRYPAERPDRADRRHQRAPAMA